MNLSLLVVAIMFIAGLFGTRSISSVLSSTTGKDIDAFRSISLIIAVLRLANESYDLIFNKRENLKYINNVILDKHYDNIVMDDQESM